MYWFLRDSVGGRFIKIFCTGVLLPQIQIRGIYTKVGS